MARDFNAMHSDRPGVTVGEDLADQNMALAFKLESAKTKIEELGRCRNCFFGTFDHGSGEGKLAKCIPMDPNNHRYCPCLTCEGTGLDPAIRSFLETL